MKLINLFCMFVTAAALSFGPLAPQVQAQCPGDVSHDLVVDGSDLAIVLGAWGSSGGALGEDINGDGIVDGIELAIVLGGWGACPPGPTWATVLEWAPNAAVVTDANLRAAIIATGLPWRVRDNASNIEMLLVPPGTFTMGCSASSGYTCFSDESPLHQVTLSAFYMGRYEVTQAQWLAEMGSNPSIFIGFSDSPSRPVERVSWNMIQPFCTQNGLRLPTEAEWEYAYRAGTTTAFHSMPGYPNGTNDDTLLGNIAWFGSNSGGQTHAVGGKSANALGLHDMAGNVYEWCQDWYSSTYYASSPSTNPTGPTTGTNRLLRGGSWNNTSRGCRASQRSNRAPDYIINVYGFRVARTP